MTTLNSFDTRTDIRIGGQAVQIYSLPALEKAGFSGVARLPYSMKILLENLLRREDDAFVNADDIRLPLRRLKALSPPAIGSIKLRQIVGKKRLVMGNNYPRFANYSGENICVVTQTGTHVSDSITGFYSKETQYFSRLPISVSDAVYIKPLGAIYRFGNIVGNWIRWICSPN